MNGTGDLEQVRDLMSQVNRALADPDAVARELKGSEKPPMFDLDFVYPPGGRRLGANLDLLSASWEITGGYAISSGRPVAGRLVVFVKRVVRALTGWYMNPLVSEIRRFNMLVVRSLAEMSLELEELRRRLEKLEGQREEERRED